MKHPSPLVISSRITSICYRSFKYLIDVRAQFHRITKVIYGYTDRKDVRECTPAEEYALFPHPFQKCFDKVDIDKANLNKYYYFPGVYGYEKYSTPERSINLQEKIHQMNTWANEELDKYIPRSEGGRRQGKTHKRRVSKKRRTIKRS